jgi:hypothetical protein
MIVNKLIFFKEGGSEKHLEDILSMLESTPGLDSQVLAEWVREFRVEPEWERVSKH